MSLSSNELDGNMRVRPLSLGNTHLSATAAIERTKLAIDTLKSFVVPWENWRVFDAFGTLLPATAASDDLGLVGGTHGTAVPSIQAGDLKAAGATNRRARVTIPLPAEYKAGETIKIRVRGGMKTTVADVSCTVDLEVYLSDGFALVDGSDICSTSAQSINSTSAADKDFTITPTGVDPGDILDVRMTVACNDAATVTAVTPCIGAVTLLCDIQG